MGDQLQPSSKPYAYTDRERRILTDGRSLICRMADSACLLAKLTKKIQRCKCRAAICPSARRKWLHVA